MMLAVIPARGGSKRFPGKNITPFGGRPLLAWSVACALRFPEMRCVVSTDDYEIAAAARNAGAAVVDRPKSLAQDDSGMTGVIRHALEVCERDRSFDGVMLLQPTNPLRPLEIVGNAIARFREEPCDSLITVSRRQLKFGRVSSGRFYPSYRPDTASQATPPVWFENGLLYLFKRSTLKAGNLCGERILAVETEKPFGDVDIDEPIDLAVGEAILTAIRDRIDY
jgi:N-acylneuraminate cytidylyltransferase